MRCFQATPSRGVMHFTILASFIPGDNKSLRATWQLHGKWTNRISRSLLSKLGFKFISFHAKILTKALQADATNDSGRIHTLVGQIRQSFAFRNFFVRLQIRWWNVSVFLNCISRLHMREKSLHLRNFRNNLRSNAYNVSDLLRRVVVAAPRDKKKCRCRFGNARRTSDSANASRINNDSDPGERLSWKNG